MGVIPKVHLPDYDSTKLPISPGWILDWREKDGKIFLLQWEGRISVASCFSEIDAGRGGRVGKDFSLVFWFFLFLFFCTVEVD